MTSLNRFVCTVPVRGEEVIANVLGVISDSSKNTHKFCFVGVFVDSKGQFHYFCVSGRIGEKRSAPKYVSKNDVRDETKRKLSNVIRWCYSETHAMSLLNERLRGYKPIEFAVSGNGEVLLKQETVETAVRDLISLFYLPDSSADLRREILASLFFPCTRREKLPDLSTTDDFKAVLESFSRNTPLDSKIFRLLRFFIRTGRDLTKGSELKKYVDKKYQEDIQQAEVRARNFKDFQNHPLTRLLVAALILYTANDISEEMNEMTRGIANGTNINIGEIKQNSQFLMLCNMALAFLPKISESSYKVYRGITFYSEDWTKGSSHIFGSIASFSKKKSVAYNFCRGGSGTATIFEAKADGAVDIEKYSSKPTECEVLFRAEQRFHVLGVSNFENNPMIKYVRIRIE